MVRLANRTVKLAVAGALLSLASAAVLPRAAAAQHPLDAAIAQRMQISGADEAEVQRWATENARALASDDPETIRRAKSALARPLRDASTTIAFRLKASQLLGPALLDAAKNVERADVAVNAAIVAADLASEAGLDLLRQLREDDRLSVRYRAIKGFGTALLLAEQSEPAFGPEAAERIVQELGERFASETEPALLTAHVTSLEQASASSRFPGMRDRALEALAKAIGARLGRLDGAVADGAELDPLVRGLIHTRSQMIRVRNPVAAPAQKAAVEAAGQMVAWGYRFARANGRLPDLERLDEVEPYRILQTGVNLAIQTLTLVAPDRRQAIEELDLPGAVGRGDAPGFLRGAGRLIGVGGVLSEPPFSVKEGTFRLE
jgi:hypothetical protein